MSSADAAAIQQEHMAQLEQTALQASMLFCNWPGTMVQAMTLSVVILFQQALQLLRPAFNHKLAVEKSYCLA